MQEKNNARERDIVKKKIGKKAEKLALNLIKQKGFKIITKNFETTNGEIDFIAKKDEILVFAEVRSRIEPTFIDPALSVNALKRKKIALTAREFVLKFKFKNHVYRFDVFPVIFNEEYEVSEIRHIENAFYSEIMKNLA